MKVQLFLNARPLVRLEAAVILVWPVACCGACPCAHVNAPGLETSGSRTVPIQ